MSVDTWGLACWLPAGVRVNKHTPKRQSFNMHDMCCSRQTCMTCAAASGGGPAAFVCVLLSELAVVVVPAGAAPANVAH